MRPVIERRFVAEFLDGEIDLHLALVLDHEAQRVGGLPDDGEIEAPFSEDRLGLGLLRRIEHHEHALLAFRQHHLVGGHASLAAGHRIEVELDAEIALGAHLDGRGGQASGPHVLNRDDAALAHDLKAGLE